MGDDPVPDNACRGGDTKSDGPGEVYACRCQVEERSLLAAPVHTMELGKLNVKPSRVVVIETPGTTPPELRSYNIPTTVYNLWVHSASCTNPLQEGEILCLEYGGGGDGYTVEQPRSAERQESVERLARLSDFLEETTPAA